MTAITKKTLAEFLTSQVSCVAPDCTVAEALAQMEAAGSCYALVIEDDRPIGLFTERDLMKSAAHQPPLTKLKIGDEVGQKHPRTESQIHIRQAELAHVARLSTLGEMASGLAHELNQPLTAISGYSMAGLEMLRGDSQSIEQVIYALEQCNEQAQRAGEIIRRMRRLVCKEEGEKEFADINSLIQEVLALTRPELRKQAIALRLELDDSLPAVYIDSIQVEQVILNLVRSAIDAMALRGVLAVRTCAKDDEWVQITVQDSGSGLDAEAMSHLFDPGYTTKAAAGFGMGLSISRSIIKSHDGCLWAESGTPGGTLFHFTLPAGRKLPDYET